MKTTIITGKGSKEHFIKNISESYNPKTILKITNSANLIGAIRLINKIKPELVIVEDVWNYINLKRTIKYMPQSVDIKELVVTIAYENKSSIAKILSDYPVNHINVKTS